MGQYDSTQDVPFIHADTTIEVEGGFTLVSVDQNSSALIKPVEHSTPKRGKRMDEKRSRSRTRKIEDDTSTSPEI